MLAVESKPSAAGSFPSRPLPLENGGFMHSREFLRRYERMPQVKKAELIEGIVYMGSPVSANHAIPDGIIHGWLALYAARNPDTQFMPNATVILDASTASDCPSHRCWPATPPKSWRHWPSANR